MCQTEFDLSTGLVPVSEFLGWQNPLLYSVSDSLLALGCELASSLVVVPTTNSGRRLRMLLSSAGSSGGGVISPHVVAPSHLFQVEGVASRQEVLWAWVRAVQQIDVDEFPHLLPNHVAGSTKGFRSALALAKQMVALRDRLADGDVSFRDAGFHSVEKERWVELDRLESVMLQNLSKWNLRDPVLAKREKAKKPDLPAGVKSVIVACVPDPTSLALRALKAFLDRDIPVKVLIHAPEEEADSFNDWGIPETSEWTQKSIPFPDWEKRFHIVDSASEATESCIHIVGENQTESDELALALCDPSFGVALGKSFEQAGWPLFDPEGKSLAGVGIMRLLRVMCDLLREQAPFSALQELVRLPGAEIFLPTDVTRHHAAKLMDELQLKHLPETVKEAQNLTSKKEAKEVISTVGEHFLKLKGGLSLDVFRSWLTQWLELTDDANVGTANAAASQLTEVLDAADRLQNFDEKLPAAEVFEMMTEALQSVRASENRDQTALDVQGWLEISYDAASHLVLAGMHEECVPDGAVDDVFVPDSLCQNLGLRDSAGRFARDAFLLQGALCSREGRGRVDAIVARFNDAGEARKPSRLLMRAKGKELASIVQHLFAESSSATSKGGAWQRDWILDLPQVDNPYLGESPHKISPSALSDYLNCPLRFYLKRVLKMNRYESRKQEMSAMDFGNLCHEVLEGFGKDSAIKDSVDHKEICEYLFESLDRQLGLLYGADLNLPLMVQLESARERLRAFAERQAEERSNGWCIVETELAVGRKNQPLEWILGGHPLMMTVDRVDRNEDGNGWRVWDYKTSGKAKLPMDQHLRSWNEKENRPLLGDLIIPPKKRSEHRWAELQLPIYAAFIQEHFKTDELPQVGYINLPRTVGDVGFEAWAGFDQSLLDSAMTWAEAAIQQIKAGAFHEVAELSSKELEWDDFAELAPDGLDAAFGI